MHRPVAISELKAHLMVGGATLVQAGRVRPPVPLECWLDEAMSILGLAVAALTVPADFN